MCNFISIRSLTAKIKLLNRDDWQSKKESLLKIMPEIIDEMKSNQKILNKNCIDIIENLKTIIGYISIIITILEVVFLTRINHFRDKSQPF